MHRCIAATAWIALTVSGQTALAEDEHHIGETTQGEETFSLEYQPIPQPPAERSHRLQWRFKRVHWAEGVAAGVFGTAAIVLELAPIHVAPHWTRNNAFDDWFQRRLIAPAQKQDRYAKASDALAATSVAFPLLIDLIGVTLIGDRNKDVGLQMFAIQAQAFAISGFVTSVVKLSGRERPCAPGADSGSDGTNCRDPNRSYFSSHTSMAFTGAGLTCAEHQHLKLLGRVGDPMACAGALALAVTTGVFRVVSNRHWMSDVITGAGVGLVTGWLMPWLMHYRHDLTKRAHGKRGYLQYVAPYGNAGAIGLSAAGEF